MKNKYIKLSRMKAQEIITNIIKNDDRFNTIKYNVKSKKIEINGEEILSLDYEDLFDLCKTEYPDTKFTKQIIKDSVIKYAREHKVEEKQNNSLNKSDWYAALEFDKKGNVQKTLNNVIKFFENYPLFKDKFAYNEFTAYENYDGELIRDFNISKFRSICESELGYESKDKVETAVQVLTHQNSYNPFKDVIDNLLWDGEERAETFFIDFVGVKDTQLNRSMTKKWLYAMIKRLYEPGCHFDNMLIIYDSKQGTGKSKIMERLVYSLGVDYGYNTSISCDNKDKDNVDKLNKTWVVGIDEMNDFLKKNPEQTKQFLAQNTDQARLSYAKRSEVYKRHCVFYGNSNLEYFLKDYTSNFERRYWIMDACGEVHDSNWWKEHLTDEYCQQVIAEMKYFYDNNPDFVYSTLSIEETKELKEIQYNHKTLNNDDIFQDKIYRILDKTYSTDTFETYSKFEEALNGNIEISSVTAEFFGEDTTTTNGMKLNKVPVKYLKEYVAEHLKREISTQYLTALIAKHWDYKNVRYNGLQVNCYVRITNEVL